MNYQKFTNPDGTVDCFVNLDAVVGAKPDGNGKVVLLSATHTLMVDAAQFEKAVSAKDSGTEKLGQLVSRLTQAIERLIVRIPTSIRLHM